MAAAVNAPCLVVIAGPNGAGKSTFFDVFLRRTGLRFVNADLIARAIAPDAPEAAAYAAAAAADAERRALVSRGESFVMETVFSDPSGDKLAFLHDAQARGYRVVFLFVGLASPELSQARVIQRVAAGGHDVPDEKLFARYPRTLANAAKALAFVDLAKVYDNSDARRPFRPLAQLESGLLIARHEPLPAWASELLSHAGG